MNWLEDEFFPLAMNIYEIEKSIKQFIKNLPKNKKLSKKVYSEMTCPFLNKLCIGCAIYRGRHLRR